MKIFYTLLLVMFYYPIYSQINIVGSVLNKNDSTTISYAHLSTFGGKIGTYSNELGQFSLSLSDTLSNDTLVISRIGYKKYNIPLRIINNSDTLIIKLEEDALNLQEIIIYDNRDSVVAIVKNILKNIKNNYPTKTHYLEGFYRELSLKGKTYTRLIEASIGVTENSYTRENNESKVKIRQLRKSEDYREYSLKSQLYEATIRKMAKLAWDFEIDNNVYKMLDTNYPKMNKQKIREENDRWHFINKYEFEIIDVVKSKNQILYKIKFYMPPETSNPIPYYGGEMTVNLQDYAIVEWEYGSKPHPYKSFPSQGKMFYMDGYFNKSHVLYSKIGDTYFPTLFEFFRPSMKGATSSINSTSGKIEHQYDKVTFMVNHIVTEKRGFDRIKKRDAVDNEIDLHDVKTAYDSAFWNSYNILLLDPLLESAQKDLEKEKLLKQQFKKNGQ